MKTPDEVVFEVFDTFLDRLYFHGPDYIVYKQTLEIDKCMKNREEV